MLLFEFGIKIDNYEHFFLEKPHQLVFTDIDFGVVSFDVIIQQILVFIKNQVIYEMSSINFHSVISFDPRIVAKYFIKYV